MRNAFYVDDTHAFVLIRPTGEFTETDFVNLCREVYDHPKREPRFAHIWDTRSIEALVMGADVIELYRHFLQDSKGSATTGDVAVVATRTMVSVLARMLAEIRKQIGEEDTFYFENLETAAESLEIPVTALKEIPDEKWIQTGDG